MSEERSLFVHQGAEFNQPSRAGYKTRTKTKTKTKKVYYPKRGNGSEFCEHTSFCSPLISQKRVDESSQSSVQEARQLSAAAQQFQKRVGGRVSLCCGAPHYAKGYCEPHYRQRIHSVRKKITRYVRSLPISQLEIFLKARGAWI